MYTYARTRELVNTHTCGFQVTREWTRVDQQVTHERYCSSLLSGHFVSANDKIIGHMQLLTANRPLYNLILCLENFNLLMSELIITIYCATNLVDWNQLIFGRVE